MPINKLDHLLNKLIESNRDIVRDIAGDIARDIVNAVNPLDISEIVESVEVMMNKNRLAILNICVVPQGRKMVLEQLGLSGNVKNYDTYMAPLVLQGLLQMTIPNKPTNPNQKYVTTLKGQIIAELLKAKGLQ
ncbi:MAG: Fic family protein [Flexibacteraceae bacterium]